MSAKMQNMKPFYLRFCWHTYLRYGLIMIGLMGYWQKTQAQQSTANTLFDSLQKKLIHTSSFEEQHHILNQLSNMLPILSKETKSQLRNALSHSQQVAQMTKKWEIKYEAYRNVGRFYRRLQMYDSAALMYNQAVWMAYEFQDSIRIKECHLEMGEYAQNTGKLSEALRYYKDALQIAHDQQHIDDVANTQKAIGEIYEAWGDYNQAAEYYEDALHLRHKQNDENGTIILQNRIGELYLHWKNSAVAYEYFEQALKLAKQSHYEIGEAYTLRNIGKVFETKKEYDNALKYYELAYNKFDKHHKIRDKVLCNIHRANTYLKKGEDEKGELFFRYAGLSAHLVNDRYLIAKSDEGLSRSYLKMKLLIKAMRATRHSMSIAKKEGYTDIIRSNYRNMSCIYEKQGNYKTSLEYYQKHISVKDSIFSKLNANKLAGMRIEAEMDKARKENEILRTQQQKQAQELDIQRMQLMMVGGGLLLMIIFLIVLFYTLRQRNQAVRKLKRKNTQIDSQYQIITKEKQKAEEVNQELQKTLQKLQATQAQMLQSEKMASVGQLTAGVAHEFNNPINFIASASETLEQDFKDLLKILEQQIDLENIKDIEEHQKQAKKLQDLKDKLYFSELPNDILEAIDDIRQGSERIEGIVRGLKIFSRLDQNMPKPIDIHENLEATLTVLHYSIQNIKVCRHYAENIPLVDCIPGEINQVFLNVLNNAIQAVDNQKGKIEITTKYDKAQHGVQILIADNGIGIPEEVHKKVFEPFFTTQDVGKGTGLGLFITHQIIENHGGIIEVANRNQGGAMCSIFLFCKTKILPQKYGVSVFST